ncbi:MAG: leucine-rich repeat domain-containing protein, partial [Ruminococcus bromii]
TIPSTYNGKPVTQILESGFANSTNLKVLTIPSSITSIKTSAFDGCSSLETVYYCGTLSQWCQLTFEKSTSNPCYNGAELYIENTLLTTVVIPDDVTILGNYAFYGCNYINQVTISQNVKTIGRYAFGKCTSITQVYIPANVINIGAGSFSNSGLKSATFASPDDWYTYSSTTGQRNTTMYTTYLTTSYLIHDDELYSKLNKPFLMI